MISSKLRTALLAGSGAMIFALGCASVEPSTGDPPARAAEASVQPTATGAPPSATVPQPVAPTAKSTDAIQAARLAHFRDVVESFSEPDAEFFSRNYISNETSFLQVADKLEEAPKGGAYLGVGPEQNFTYIALTRPDVAYIVDIRRQNLLLHLLYKAIFQEADHRTSFVALLIGRQSAGGADRDGASVDELLASISELDRDVKTFEAIHRRLVERIEDEFGIPLSPSDQEHLREAHEAFFKQGLDLRFELDFNNGRRYPSLGELLAAEDPTGEFGSFLFRQDRYEVVRDLERAHLVIPVVGNFAGDGAMPKLAKALAEHKQPVRYFYVSNVEQYLFEPGVWPKWVRNVSALPIDSQSMFIRAYLDQGRAHPSQLEGHRTASLLQPIAPFVEGQPNHPSKSFWQLVTE